MAKRYELKRRAERQEQTRQRIVAAAVGLHTTVGPLGTTDSAIAARAGVTRVTFYRHFPDDVTLFRACQAHGLERWPPPDPEAWSAVADPVTRLRTALRATYAYYRMHGPGLVVILRDAPQLRPELLDVPSRRDVFARMGPILARGWGVRGRRVSVGRAAIEHALAVTTWDGLVRRGAVTEDEAVELLVGLVRAAYAGPPDHAMAVASTIPQQYQAASP